MKTNSKFIGLTICIFCLTQGSLSAQEKGDHEINLGYGYYSYDYFITDSGLRILFGVKNPDHTKTTGSIFLDYNYALSENWYVGVLFGYEKLSEIYQSLLRNIDVQSNFQMQFYTIAAEGEYRYILKPSFHMYSGIGIGYSIISESFEDIEGSRETMGAINFHLNFAGIRIGNKVAFKAELGFGYKGVVNGGLSIKI